jgi:hypothetical protein
MNQKFKFKIAQGQVIFDDATKQRRTDYVRSLPDGEYEDVIRPEIKWDTDRMRKYFHGPVLKFIVEQFKGLGCLYSKDQVKEYLKLQFGPTTESKTGRMVIIPKSTSEYDFKTYTQFLKDINLWCIECFECELPPSDEVE